MFDKEIGDKYGPKNEPYLGARVLALLPRLIGKRGEFVVGLFSYLRWVDDLMDEGKQPTKSKLEFMERQMVLATGIDEIKPANPEPEEEFFSNLPWNVVPRETRHRVQMILGSVIDDVNNQGFKVRTDREIRHYNWRTMWPIMDGLFLVLNGKPAKPGVQVMRFLDACVRIGSLEGLGDDLSQEVIKLPVEFERETAVTKQSVLEKLDEKWFSAEKKRNLNEIAVNALGFLKLDIPAWQKLLCLGYAAEILVTKSLGVSLKKAIQGAVSETVDVGNLNETEAI
ncbi:hypothetical protein A2397_01930 [Candidatus Amesbacteria bacterium RIFOXYB1_FULL_44_23]|uniref:Uncharacterized protein n=1 Tax=Candidatus Amesbacteria bacterium RIFOXYB1_FULL_44_23 TaxID=1797263 RepID=A0A1F4ZVF3_9BACT|nr:MAG: hypothetical protein A2397_01930 [Candidatus Amesbacteria bacterium RIFOXYB1_FULL_44_23]